MKFVSTFAVACSSQVVVDAVLLSWRPESSPFILNVLGFLMCDNFLDLVEIPRATFLMLLFHTSHDFLFLMRFHAFRDFP